MMRAAEKATAARPGRRAGPARPSPGEACRRAAARSSAACAPDAPPRGQGRRDRSSRADPARRRAGGGSGRWHVPAAGPPPRHPAGGSPGSHAARRAGRRESPPRTNACSQPGSRAGRPRNENAEEAEHAKRRPDSGPDGFPPQSGPGEGAFAGGRLSSSGPIRQALALQQGRVGLPVTDHRETVALPPSPRRCRCCSLP